MAVIQGTILDDGGAVYNVRNSTFGATGNGTTDDTAAIQAAIDAAAAAGGGTVYVPKGNYKHTFFTLYGRVDLVGEAGAVLLCAGTQTHGTTIAIAVGVKANPSPTPPNPLFLVDTWTGKIENIHFSRHSSFTFSDGNIVLNIFSATDYAVVRCRMTSITNASAIKHNSDGAWTGGQGQVRSAGRFLYNHIDGGATSATPQQEGISIQRVYLDQSLDDRAVNMQVIGNTILNVADDPIAGHGVSDFWVRDNYCRSRDGHITANDCFDFHILANDCAHTSNDAGTGLIWVGATFDTYAVGSKRGEIRFNRLTIPATAGNEPNPIFAVGATDLEITHNSITNLSTGRARIYVGPNDRKIGNSDGGRTHLPYARVLVDDNVLVNTGIFFAEPEGEPVRTGWIRARRNTSTLTTAETANSPATDDTDSRHIRVATARFADDDVDPRGWNSVNHRIDGGVVAQPELLCEWYAKDIADVTTVQMIRFDSVIRWYAPADVMLTTVTVESDQDLPTLGAAATVQVNSGASIINFGFYPTQLPRLWTQHVNPGIRMTRGQYAEASLTPYSHLTGRDVVLRLYGVRLNRMAV